MDSVPPINTDLVARFKQELTEQIERFQSRPRMHVRMARIGGLELVTKGRHASFNTSMVFESVIKENILDPSSLMNGGFAFQRTDTNIPYRDAFELTEEGVKQTAVLAQARADNQVTILPFMFA